jgi:hypothetical protein
MPRPLFLLFLLPTLAPAQAPTSAQFQGVLSIGSRARVTSSAIAGRPAGAVVEIGAEHLTLAADGGILVRVPIGSIQRVETSLGRSRQVLRGVVIGVAVGVLSGVFMDVDPEHCGGDSDAFCRRTDAIIGGVGAGALVGAGIGALVKGERWATVSLAPTLTARGNARISLAVRTAWP